MGIKSVKPVVKFEDADAALTTAEKAALRRLYEQFAGSTTGTISKDQFARQLNEKVKIGRPVIDRLFEIVDYDGSKSVDLNEFICAMFVFLKGTRDQKLRLVFNMFDASGGEAISKRDLKKMVLAIIVGNQSARDGPDDSKSEPLDISYFKPMTEIMVESAMVMYDRDNDGKLSFDEWKAYAEDDDEVMGFINAMTGTVQT